MIQSMTGFGSREVEVVGVGKICVELRGTNHKFLETVLHLPEGLLSLEERVKKDIESKIKRGRITCAVNISGRKGASVFINKPLLKNYFTQLKNLKKQLRLKEEIKIDTLIHLPGVLSLEETKILAGSVWPHLKVIVHQALSELLKMRQKEGRATHEFLKRRSEMLKADLNLIKSGFKKALKEKLGFIATDEERSVFLKETDITEEIERLEFHIGNFKNKLSAAGPVGKELDFIAQEMQREANTLAAKTFDAAISSRAIQMKSQVEKIREQVQNIE